MSLVIPDELSKSPLHVGIEGITSEDLSEEMSSTPFSVTSRGRRGTQLCWERPEPAESYRYLQEFEFLGKPGTGLRSDPPHHQYTTLHIV